MALKPTKPMQASQKAVSPKAAKVGKKPAKMLGKNTAKTKKVAKTPTNFKGKLMAKRKPTRITKAY